MAQCTNTGLTDYLSLSHLMDKDGVLVVGEVAGTDMFLTSGQRLLVRLALRVVWWVWS